LSARQLGLPFLHESSYPEADFVPAASNAAARAWLAQPWPGKRLALWGGEGTGKTHLLHAWAGRAGAAVLYGPELRRWHAEARARVAPWALAVDDADLAADEAVLLHLLNTAADGGRPVLLAGREPPARWAVALPDLASRLRATAAVGLGPADDALLRALLARLLSERQVVVAQPLQDWLLLRLPRNAAAMREVAARLDRLALARGGPVTRALAAEAVAALAGDDDGPATEAVPASPSGSLLL
jgi:chromosomal replication initiation ATPase DnaA